MKYTVILFLSLFLFSSCERYYRNVGINHEAEACGVYQPVHNIDWLRAYDSEMSYRVFNTDNRDCFDIIVTVYENNSTGESIIATFCNTWYSAVSVRACDGTLLMGGEWGNPHSDYFSSKPKMQQGRYSEEPVSCLECDTFFEKYHFVDYLSRYEYKLIE